MVWLAIIGFGAVMLLVGIMAGRSVDSVEEFAVAGRRLGLTLAVPTLLATWFGAGTLMVAADEVAHQGISAAALDPLGAGTCLLLAGALLAGPLWRMKLTTLPDFFGRTFGDAAELSASALMIPGYLGWIAVQFTVLAGLLAWLTGIDPAAGLAFVGVLGIAYTLVGGMWAVTVTDVVQMALVAAGLVTTGVLVLGMPELGNPMEGAIGEGTSASAFTAAFLAGSLGNLPGQDLTQRMFAARSATVAQLACLIAGVLYLVLGTIPVMLALAASNVLPVLPDERVLIGLAEAAGTPLFATAFSLTVAAAVLSTIDSAILAPSTVLARNLLGRLVPETVGLHRLAVLVIGVLSLSLAYVGEDAYSLLEGSYELGMVTLLVPLIGGIYLPRSGTACLLAMGVGTSVWLVHLAFGAEGFAGSAIPVGLAAMCLAALAYALGPKREAIPFEHLEIRPLYRSGSATPSPAATQEWSESGAYELIDHRGVRTSHQRLTVQQLVWQGWVLSAGVVAAAWGVTMLVLVVLCFAA